MKKNIEVGSPFLKLWKLEPVAQKSFIPRKCQKSDLFLFFWRLSEMKLQFRLLRLKRL